MAFLVWRVNNVALWVHPVYIIVVEIISDNNYFTVNTKCHETFFVLKKNKSCEHADSVIAGVAGCFFVY
jgi:hypothetical protein